MKIGFIGLGDRIASLMKDFLDLEPGMKIFAAYDANPDYAKEQLKARELPVSDTKFVTSVEKLLKLDLDGIMVGTRCDSHTQYALQVLKRGIPLFLEKPVCTNREQLLQLEEADREPHAPVVVSFPLRVSPLVTLAKKLIVDGEIGWVQQVQAVNNVPYGRVYYHNWYRDESVTGGLFLQKATHDLDYINFLIDSMPKKVAATETRMFFHGNKPAGLHCKDCNEYATCPESQYVIEKLKYDNSKGPMCCFAEDTGNQDSGSVLVKYENGVQASYVQNFVARNGAATRGAKIIGYKGTIDFDWYTDTLIVHNHEFPVSATHKFDASRMSHFGGDRVLLHNFICTIKGTQESLTPLSAGILSAKLCLAARESAQTEQFVALD